MFKILVIIIFIIVLLLTLTVCVHKRKVSDNVLAMVWSRSANGSNPSGSSLVTDVLIGAILSEGS